MLYVGAVKSRAGEASSWAGRRTMERGGELTDREGKVTARDDPPSPSGTAGKPRYTLKRQLGRAPLQTTQLRDESPARGCDSNNYRDGITEWVIALDCEHNVEGKRKNELFASTHLPNGCIGDSGSYLSSGNGLGNRFFRFFEPFRLASNYSHLITLLTKFLRHGEPDPRDVRYSYDNSRHRVDVLALCCCGT
eukprot:1195240-Prorocentrum_minimum.AAC.5